MPKLVPLVLLAACCLRAQPDGLWQGYDGEWRHVSSRLLDAIPAGKYSWRPVPGVRTVSEVFMHIALANDGLVGITGRKPPVELNPRLEKTVARKAQVIEWLEGSLEFVKTERAQLKPADLGRAVKVENRDATVDGMYLRAIVHANEHMGQMIAYARTMGLAPPWSKGAAE